MSCLGHGTDYDMFNVLSCLSCLVLSCAAWPVLSCLACLVLSCLVMSCSVLSCFASLVLPVLCLALPVLPDLCLALPCLSCLVLPVLSWWCDSYMLWQSCSDTQHMFTLLSCLLARLVVGLVWLVLSLGWRSDTRCSIAAAGTVRHNVLISCPVVGLDVCLFHWLCFPSRLALPCLWWIKLGV